MRDYNKDFKFKYVLNKIHGKLFIKKIMTFDTETHDNNQKFTLGSVFDGDSFLVFNDKEDMRKYLLDKRYQNTLLCATNLQFDFCALEDVRNFYSYKIISRGGRFIQVVKQTKYENRNHEGHDVTFANVFIDSLNHYAGSVENAGKIVGLKKMDSPYFLGKEPSTTLPAYAVNSKGEKYKVEPEITEYEYLKEYNKRDSEVTYKLMTFLQNTYNSLGCEMKTTISSTALDLWKRKYLPCELIREDYILGKNIKDEIFKTYYGGRTEIFGRGLIESDENTKWKLFDINSLYPSVMCLKYPLPQSIMKPSEYTIDNIKKYEGFSEVEIECDYMFYPLLPYRDVKRGKLIFPYGHWKASYTNLELRKALELGYRIKKIFTQYIYTKTFYPFRDYVTDLYQKRMEYKRDGNPMEVVTKLLMNSIYGKLAQKDFIEYHWFDISEMTPQEYNDYLNSNNTTVYGNVGFTRTVKECDTNFIFPILASYVTSYGRLRLYEYLVKYNACYADTDSIITKEDVPNSNVLGEMKLEDEIKKAILIRPKLYMKQDVFDKVKVKVKGVPKVSIESFEHMLQHDRVYFNKFIKPTESIRRGWNVNEVRQDSKSVDLEDNKREWSKQFDYKTFDFNSKPLYIDIMEEPVKKHVIRKTVNERKIISEQEYKKNKDKLRKQFLESDLFDLNSVGQDITPEEFVENEEWFDKRGL